MNTVNTRVAALLTAALVLSGCATVKVAPEADGGAVSYSMGVLGATEEVGIEKLWQAGNKALADLGIAVTDESKTEPTWIITGRGSHDLKVTLKLRAVAEHLTHVQITSGSGGDYTTSLVILRRMREMLTAGRKAD